MILGQVVIVRTLGLAPAGVLMPVMLTLAEILLGIGQACVTFLRTDGW